MRLHGFLLGTLLAVACASSPSSEKPAAVREAGAGAEPVVETRSDAMATSKDPNSPPPTSERGPAITPATELVAWLDQQGKGLVRLPVTLVLAATGSVETATLGVNGEADAVSVAVSDHQMGISLKDRLRKHCKPGGTCTVWLVGQWAGDGKAKLDVRRLDGVIGPDELAGATHAESVDE